MLIENTLFGLKNKVKIAIEQLRDVYKKRKDLVLAFSGGKDSIVIRRLKQMSGIITEDNYSITTIDPPDLIRFINKHHKNVNRIKPKKPLLQMMIDKGFPPTRIMRWCCAEYKENGNDGKMVITGVRAAESAKRAKRKNIEFCYRNTGKIYLNLIIDWTNNDVWEFIKAEGLPYCSLYDEGWKRIGCLMCPMGRTRRKLESLKYPKITKLFIKYFEKLYKKNIERGKDMSRWENGEDMFNQWIEDRRKPKEIPDQTVMFE